MRTRRSFLIATAATGAAVFSSGMLGAIPSLADTIVLSVYVMPIIGTGTKTDPRRPKYLSTFQAFSWGMFDYGDEPQCLVGVQNIDAATDATLRADAGVFTPPGNPQNLDQAIGGGGTLNNLRNGLESDDIPGTWITSTTTYRMVIEFIGACCQFMQRYQGQSLPFVFQAGVSLSTTYGSLPAQAQQGLLTAAQSFGFNTSSMVSGSTLRTIIKAMADQYTAAQMPLILASVNLYNSQPV